LKGLILNGAGAADGRIDSIAGIIADELASRGCDASEARLRDVDIAGCAGCYRCWVATPGVCAINDPGRAIAAVMIRSDVAVFLTPIVFGGYSYDLKKALDRSIPLILPFFRKIHGEVHHQMRYDKYPRIVGVGVQSVRDDENARIFRQLVARNALNFSAPGSSSLVVDATPDTGQIAGGVGAALDEAGVRK
jgi:multimeric flavodoxin WrbA